MSNLLPVIDKLEIGVIKDGERAKIYTSEGEYIDMFADNGTVSLGYDYKVKTLPHLPSAYKDNVREEAAKKICEVSNMDYAFFSNSGAESVEAMMKFARKYQNPKSDLYFLDGAFHGRTFGTMSADFTGKGYHYEGYEPFLPGVKKFKSINHRDIRPDAAAVIITPADVYGDFVKYDKEWLKELEEYCHKHNILLTFDEVQTYIRTGEWWGYQLYDLDIEPDMICTAKGVAGGYPTGVTLMKKEIGDSINKGGHFSTFGGNPTSMIGILDTVRKGEKLRKEVQEKGEFIMKKLENTKAENIRGNGLIMAFDVPGSSLEFRDYCLENGILLGIFSDSQSIKLTPPLTITWDSLDKVIEVFTEWL